MKTRCPSCQTTFRVTPEQLKARAGKVRCGQCQTVFNALDSLLDETPTSAPSTPHVSAAPRPASEVPTPSATTMTSSVDEKDGELAELTFETPIVAEAPPPEVAVDPMPVEPMLVEPILAEPARVEPTLADAADGDPAPLSEAAAQELGMATGLIMPRETTAIPGYSKWAEGVIAAPLAPAAEKATRWPFFVAALVLVVALAGQIVFRFRSEIAITMPSLRPALELLSQGFDAEIPLPRHVELVSIETSDLQSDPAHGNLLVLNATLRNRAGYGQAYPSLELSLTDTQDAAIARKVFAPTDYLSAKTPAGPAFAANSEIAVRLWIEAREIAAAGYRLYVFYP